MTTPTEPTLRKFDFKLLDKRGNTMVLITPEDAEALLADHNRHNRSVKESKINKWVTAMKAGRWDPDASDIKVDFNGDLIDGQHRLIACVRAGVSIGTLLRTGLNPETQRRVDIGAARTTADTFKLEGIPWANNTAAAILLRRRYEEGEARGLKVTSNLRIDLSPDEVLDYFRANPSHEKYPTLADRMYRIGPGIARTVYFAALPMFADADDAEAERFAEAFVNGEWGGPGSPLQALVRYMSQARTPGVPGYRAQNVNERHLLALVKTWNAWRMNEPLDKVKVADNDPLIPVV
jgi:hypothetical protein